MLTTFTNPNSSNKWPAARFPDWPAAFNSADSLEGSSAEAILPEVLSILNKVPYHDEDAHFQPVVVLTQPITQPITQPKDDDEDDDDNEGVEDGDGSDDEDSTKAAWREDKREEAIRRHVAANGFLAIIVRQTDRNDVSGFRIVHHITCIREKWYGLADGNVIVRLPDTVFRGNGARSMHYSLYQLLNIDCIDDLTNLQMSDLVGNESFIPHNSTIIGPEMFSALQPSHPFNKEEHVIVQMAAKFLELYSNPTDENSIPIEGHEALEYQKRIGRKYLPVLRNLISQNCGDAVCYNPEDMPIVENDREITQVMERICVSYLFTDDEKEGMSRKRKQLRPWENCNKMFAKLTGSTGEEVTHDEFLKLIRTTSMPFPQIGGVEACMYYHIEGKCPRTVNCRRKKSHKDPDEKEANALSDFITAIIDSKTAA
jgi:hypothetical protein